MHLYNFHRFKIKNIYHLLLISGAVGNFNFYRKMIRKNKAVIAYNIFLSN